jgi:hypothetical protein
MERFAAIIPPPRLGDQVQGQIPILRLAAHRGRQEGTGVLAPLPARPAALRDRSALTFR